MYHTNSNMYYRTAGLELQGFYYQLLLEIVLYFTEEDRERDFNLVGQESFFPKDISSQSWEFLLVFRKYPEDQIIFIIFIFIGASGRFEVSNVRLSTKVVI